MTSAPQGKSRPVRLNVLECTWLNPEAEGRRVDTQTSDWHLEASAKHIPAGGPAILARAPVHQPLSQLPARLWACLKLPATCSALLACMKSQEKNSSGGAARPFGYQAQAQYCHVPCDLQKICVTPDNSSSLVARALDQRTRMGRPARCLYRGL